MEAFEVFCAFMVAEKVAIRRMPTLEETVEKNFDVLDENLSRRLIARALEERDKKNINGESNATSAALALGHWQEIIDVVRIVTQRRHVLAIKNAKMIVEVSQDGDAPKMINFLRSLKARNEIDRYFVEILEASMSDCAKRSDEDSSNSVAMYQFVLDVIKRLIVTAPSSATAAKKLSSSTTGGESETDNDINMKRGGGASNSESESEREREAKAPELMKIGTWLQGLLKTVQGDTGRLRTLLFTAVDSGTYAVEDIKVVLEDNIEASRQMNYTNKLKIFEFLISELNKRKADDIESNMNAYHAPKFVDSVNKDGWKNVDIDDKDLNILISAPVRFIEGKCATEIKIANRKNKKEKKKKEEALGEVSSSVGNHLEGAGWSVCDDFISMDLVRRVRTEVDLFKDYYEMSEIWVGKRADVGAHLQVPSVRGDKVLWMCGAHQAPEGVTRHVKTIGDVEPCKLKIKAAAPTRKFTAIRELIDSVDSLVEDMKEKFPHLSGIYERSDAMFANYAGAGSRFANHIDNTVGDGRILTILIYLNPDWSEELGGALRITQPDKSAIENYVREKTLINKPEKLNAKPTPPPAPPSSTKSDNDEDDDVIEIGPDGTFDTSNVKPKKTLAPPTPPSSTSSPSSSSSSSTSSAQGNGIPLKAEKPIEPTITPIPTSTTSPTEPVKLIDVYPKAGRMAIFYSSLVQHEVLPTFGDRHSITIWYYDRSERHKAIERAQESGLAAETSKTSEESQKEAKVFMSALMGNKGPSDTSRVDRPVSTEELTTLREKVRKLSEDATKIVSSITGAPSPQSFKEGFEIITTDDLYQMRHLFSRMGLGN